MCELREKIAAKQRLLEEPIPYDFLRRYLGGDPMLIAASISLNGLNYNTRALIDTGANGYVFISKQLARRLYTTLKAPKIVGFHPQKVGGYDGKASQQIDTAALATFVIQGRRFRETPMLVLDMPQEMIVGRLFLAEHGILTDCRHRRLQFPESLPSLAVCYRDIDMTQSPDPRSVSPIHQSDADRRDAALEKKDQSASRQRMIQRRIQALEKMTERPPSIPRRAKLLARSGQTWEIPTARETYADPNLQEMQRELYDLPRPKVEVTSLSHTQRKETREAEGSSRIQKDAKGKYILKRDAVGWYKDRQASVAMIGAIQLMRLVQEDSALYCTSINEIDDVLRQKNAERLLPDDDGDLRAMLLERVPEHYHDLLDVFSKVESDQVPPFRPGSDHNIQLEGDPRTLGYSPLYKMTEEELEACRKYLQENLQKGFIEPGSTPWAAPILFARKGDGGLRFCVDYRKLNALTKKDVCPLPLIEETLARISKARFFTKIDIRQAFHRIRMNPEHRDYTTFRTRYGTFRYNVLPFGLTNGPATFQKFINEILMEYLDDFCSAYMDDILIWSETEEEHQTHVRQVLERLKKAGLQADIKKCEFHVTETRFLGFIIGTKGVAVDPDKVAAVKQWAPPTTVKGVQSFLGFCNFYRKFVPEYSRVAKPLTNLTKKAVPFQWDEHCRVAFDTLKKALTSAPILAHYQADYETRVETDASGGVVAGALLQQNPNTQKWHPIAFFSETMQQAELNYPIHDKELLAVVRALKTWRPELMGTKKKFVAITDYKALEYFSTKRLLNSRQAAWADFFSQYNFEITYRPGSENVLADALTRKAEDVQNQKERQEAERYMAIFRPVDSAGDDLYVVNPFSYWQTVADGGFGVLLAAIEPTGAAGQLLFAEEVLRANEHSPLLEQYRIKARNPEEKHWTLLHDKHVLYRRRLVIPGDGEWPAKVIREVHGTIATAHPGRNKTRRLVAQQFWWPGMSGMVDRYVANCSCRSAKVPRDKTPGLLQPLPVPDRQWSTIVVDFKSMPKSKSGNDNLFVIIDALTKRSWAVPCTRTATAKDAAMMYYEGPYRVYGLPTKVVSDRGPQFVSDLIDEMSKILQIKWKLSTAGHSQTAGQAEIMNAYIDQRLRPHINHFQDDWDKRMPAIDLVQATLPHDSLGGFSPFEIGNGYPAHMHFDWTQRTELKGLPTRERLTRTEAQAITKKLESYVEAARTHLQMAQQRMCDQANKHRREPDFGVGSAVYIIKKHWVTDRPSDKLDYPLTRCSYVIKEKRGHSYRLELPDSWKGSRVFHADRLRLDPRDPLDGQAAERPEGEVIDASEDTNEEEWEVERVISSRVLRGVLQYQVQWRGWDPDPEFYDAEGFKNAAVQLRQYHNAYPDKAGPPMRLEAWEKAALENRFDPPDEYDNAPATGNSTASRLRRRR